MERAAQQQSKTPPKLEFPDKFTPFLSPKRYKVAYGGRGGAKSWTIARLLLYLAARKKLRILCTRQFQNSINESVYRLLVNQIYELGLEPWYDIQKTTILSKCGSDFIFAGLAHNIQEIKSIEGIDIVWVEEAQAVVKDAWDILIPTIRKEGSEIWVSFNPLEEDDPVYVMFVDAEPDPDTLVIKVGWQDNPWFPEVLNKERLKKLRTDPMDYDHIWEGDVKKLSSAAIMLSKCKLGQRFITPTDRYIRFYHGVDWGFAQSPTVITRCWISENEDLMVDQEEYGTQIELDHTPAMFDRIPTSRMWPLKADCARPETISYIRRQGFNITPAEKWPGSIEDGIEHLRAFRNIVVHERLERLPVEARRYRYKVDPKTGQILPIVVDAWNDAWDSIRYGLDGMIQSRGNNVVWARLAGK